MIKTLNTDNSGIIIKDTISLSLEKRKSSDVFFLIIIALMGSIGTIGSFLSMFDFMVNSGEKILLTGLCSIIASVSFTLPKKLRFSPLIVLFIWIAIIFFSRYDTISGFKLSANLIIEETGLIRKGYSTFNVLKLESLDSYMGKYYVSVFLDNLIFILCFLISWITIKLQKFAPVFLITFPFVEIGIAFGIVPSYLYLFILVAFWISLLCTGSSSYLYNLRDPHTNFIKRGNTFLSKSNIRYKVTGTAGIIIFIISFLLLCSISFFVNFSGYSRSDKIDELRYVLDNSTIPSINDVVDIFSTDSPLVHQKKGGKLGRLDKLTVRNRTMMKVSIEPALDYDIATAMTSPVYLRGNVYSAYKVNSWEVFDSQIYNNSDNWQLFDDITTSGLNPIDMYGENFKRSSDVQIAKISVYNVKDKSASQYVPYGTYSASGDYAFDYLVRTSEIDGRYSFLFNTPSQNAKAKHFSSAYEFDIYNADVHSKNIKPKWEDDYENFISNYCYYPETDAMEKVREAYSDTIEQAKSASNDYAALRIIRDAIQQDCTYSLSPGRVPADRDLVEYFLLESQKGYCTYFATSAAIICRMSGIPCRYVEGYVLDNQDYSSALHENDSIIIEVKDSRAHAWVEVYIPELGWLPFEFTPGYSEGGNPNDDYQESRSSESETTSITTKAPASETTPVSATNVTDTATAAPIVTTQNPNLPSNPSSKDEAPNYVNRTISVLIGILFLLIIGLLYLYLREKKIRYHREKSLKSSSEYERAMTAFEYLSEMLDYMEICRSPDQTYTDFANYVEGQIDDFSNGEFLNISKIVSKAQFSQHSLTSDEADRVVSLARKFSKKIYDCTSGIKKLYLKYLINI